MRERLRLLVSHPQTERAVTLLIVINAVILGLETSPSAMALMGPSLLLADQIILSVFVIEIMTRQVVNGWNFWRDPWSVFDFFVVAIALVPATENLSVLRALRILRALRLVSAIKSMRRVVGGLIHAIPGMGSIVALLLLVFYVFSVMATKLFGANFPQWFGTIGESAYSLFQIMTLESWSMGIVRPIMEIHSWAWTFFVPFILVTSFTVLNLFIGIIVDAMQSQHEEEEEDAMRSEKAQQHTDMAEVTAELRAMRAELSALHAVVGKKR